MDIPLILERLRPGEDWGSCADSSSTYEEMKKSWRSEASSCPTKAEMLAAWETIQAEEKTREQAVKSLRASAVEILKNDVPDEWRTSSNPMQRVAWALKRVLVEIRQEFKEGGA